MSWVMTSLAVAGAVKGVADAGSNRKAAKEHDKYRQAVLENSYWTKMGDIGGFQGGNQGYLSSALGGGVSGASTGATITSLGKKAASGGTGDVTGDVTGGDTGGGTSGLALQGQSAPAEYSLGLPKVDFTQSPNTMGQLPPVLDGGVYGKVLGQNVGAQLGRHSELVPRTSSFGTIAEPINMYDPVLHGPYGNIARK